ncbi:MAG: FeoB small GTPase domain-containing protein, partial [Fidelibacterota bacterium]
MKSSFFKNKFSSDNDSKWIALVGNPNCGKTAIFNLLTGLNQKVSNYPGVTVEKKTGLVRSENLSYKVLDLPGTYSLQPESFDEEIVLEQITNWAKGEMPPDILISVVDASNLARNLFLTSQLIDLNIPIIVALNMMDRLNDHEKIDYLKLANKLGVNAVVPISAKKNQGFDELKLTIETVLVSHKITNYSLSWINSELVDHLIPLIETQFDSKDFAIAQSLRMVSHAKNVNGDSSRIKSIQQVISNLGYQPQTVEAILRYRWIDDIVSTVLKRSTPEIKNKTVSEKWDQILTHRWFGPVIFIAILYFIFQSIFTWATVPMDWIQVGVDQVSVFILSKIPSGMLRDILVEGIIGGVGAIIIFLPQILILSLFLTLLEDTGYMARVAFMLDRGMTKMGLHGKSVLPLMSGYACAIPGIMS